MEEKRTTHFYTNELSKFFLALSFISALVALLMIFAPAINVIGVKTSAFKDGTTLSYSGWDISFGYKSFTAASANMLTYFALIIGIVFSALAGNHKLGEGSYVIAIIAFLYAALGFILTDVYANYGQTHFSYIDAWTFVSYAKPYCELGGGAIAGIVFSFFAAFCHGVALKTSWMD